MNAELNLGRAVSKRPYNTNNAWGFGGSCGTEVVFDSGWTHRTGRLCYRHEYRGLPTKAEYWVSPEGKRCFTPDEVRKALNSKP